MKQITITLSPLGKQIQAGRGFPLLDVLHEFGIEFPCGGKGTCGKCKVKLLSGHIATNPSHSKKLEKLRLVGNWRLACQSIVEEDLVLEVGQYETMIQADETEFEFEPGKGLGVAVDLGTTTLVCQLLDLESGKILAVETAINPQVRFGSDLITRLESSMQKGSIELRQVIRQKIGEMIGQMMAEREHHLEKIILVGNTVMHHLFCGLDTLPLSFYPFESSQLEAVHFSSGELGWDSGLCGNIRFLPSIGSFVGSDILAGILATGMHRRKTHSMLIDLGTNGEIAVGNSQMILCASTAAGPAFEGARISQGMQATTGAISSVDKLGKKWKSKVIGNTSPRGICGSGLIDAISVFKDAGQLGRFGEILSGEPAITLDEPVKISQKDIYEFQLAKAAIAAGTKILMNELSLTPEKVECIYIAGGFGNYINLENVVRVGMLDFPASRMRKLGNSALIGAKMFLFSGPGLPKVILERVRHVNLESVSQFQDLFIAEMEI